MVATEARSRKPIRGEKRQAVNGARGRRTSAFRP
jgi:hypothetical protein